MKWMSTRQTPAQSRLPSAAASTPRWADAKCCLREIRQSMAVVVAVPAAVAAHASLPTPFLVTPINSLTRFPTPPALPSFTLLCYACSCCGWSIPQRSLPRCRGVPSRRMRTLPNSNFSTASEVGVLDRDRGCAAWERVVSPALPFAPKAS